eukprot:1383342-Amorphochlora_amoeboformis.AAC.1
MIVKLFHFGVSSAFDAYHKGATSRGAEDVHAKVLPTMLTDCVCGIGFEWVWTGFGWFECWCV